MCTRSGFCRVAGFVTLVLLQFDVLVVSVAAERVDDEEAIIKEWAEHAAALRQRFENFRIEIDMTHRPNGGESVPVARVVLYQKGEKYRVDMTYLIGNGKNRTRARAWNGSDYCIVDRPAESAPFALLTHLPQGTDSSEQVDIGRRVLVGHNVALHEWYAMPGMGSPFTKDGGFRVISDDRHDPDRPSLRRLGLERPARAGEGVVTNWCIIDEANDWVIVEEVSGNAPNQRMRHVSKYRTHAGTPIRERDEQYVETSADKFEYDSEIIVRSIDLSPPPDDVFELSSFGIHRGEVVVNSMRWWWYVMVAGALVLIGGAVWRYRVSSAA